MNKHNKHKEQNEKDEQTTETFDKLYRKTLQDKVIDRNGYESVSNIFS